LEEVVYIFTAFSVDGVMFCRLFPVAGNAWAGFSTSPAVCLFVYVHYDTLLKSGNRAAVTDTVF
jgi:hypothetical protein